MPTPDPPTPTSRDVYLIADGSMFRQLCRDEVETLYAFVRTAESTAAELLKAQQREDEICANLRSALGEPLDTPLTAFNMVDVLRGEWAASVRELLKARERIAELERENELLKKKCLREWNAGFNAATGAEEE